MNRIPQLTGLSVHHVKEWVYALYAADLIFHFDDAPETIETIESGTKTFSAEECVTLNTLLPKLFDICSKSGIDLHEIAHDCHKLYINWSVGLASFDFRGEYEDISNDERCHILVVKYRCSRTGEDIYGWDASVDDDVIESGQSWTATDALREAREACQQVLQEYLLE